MRTDGNQWVANGKAVGKFKWYVFLFVINGNSVVDYWKHSNGTFHQSSLIRVQWHITGNILVALISIQLQWKFNVISLGIF